MSINKKKVYIFTVLLSLMFILVCMQQLFKENVRKIALSNNNIRAFRELNVGDGKYQVLLPETWSIDERNKNIDGIEFEATINDNNKINGTISILDRIKEIDNIPDTIFKDVKSEDYNVYDEYGIKWHVLEYKMPNDDEYKNICYFRKYSRGKILIINFHFDESEYKPSIKVAFDKVAEGFK